METRILTVMFTDIVNFSDKIWILSRNQVDKFISEQKEIIEPIISEFSGKVVKTVWDSYMVAFISPTKAVLCWIKIQDEIFKKNKNWVWEFFELRIWINTWEINIKSRDLFWEPVNIASRVESVCTPWDVFFTESTYLNMNRNEVESKKVWFRELKWINHKVLLYKAENKNLLDKNIKKIKLYKNFNKKSIFYVIYWVLFIIFLSLLIIFFSHDVVKKYENKNEENNIKLNDTKLDNTQKNIIKLNNNSNDIVINREFSAIYFKKVNSDIEKFIKSHYSEIENKNYDVAYNNYLNNKFDSKTFKKMFLWVRSIVVSQKIINFWDDNYNYKLGIINEAWQVSNYIITSKIVKSNWKYKIASYNSYLIWETISERWWENFIKNHYKNLSNKNFDLVYNNYIKNSKNLYEFKKMYIDLDKVEILNIKAFFENEYIVKLKLDFKDWTSEIYQTILKLKKDRSGKIKILSYSSEKIK